MGTFTFLSIVAAIYLLPTIIRIARGERWGGMLLLNLAFAWTGVGWLVLMVWALSRGGRRDRITVTNHVHNVNANVVPPRGYPRG
jgi:T4 superinfection immunity protein